VIERVQYLTATVIGRGQYSTATVIGRVQQLTHRSCISDALNQLTSFCSQRCFQSQLFRSALLLDFGPGIQQS